MCICTSLTLNRLLLEYAWVLLEQDNTFIQFIIAFLILNFFERKLEAFVARKLGQTKDEVNT